MFHPLILLQTPIFFKSWNAVLAASSLALAVHSAHRTAIIRFLKRCKDSRCPATVAGIKDFLQGPERSGAMIADNGGPALALSAGVAHPIGTGVETFGSPGASTGASRARSSEFGRGGSRGTGMGTGPHPRHPATGIALAHGTGRCFATENVVVSNDRHTRFRGSSART